MGKTSLFVTQLALLLGQGPIGPVHSIIVGNSNRKYQESSLDFVALLTSARYSHPVLIALAGGSRVEEEFSPFIVAPARLAQFLPQRYPGVYSRDRMPRLG